MKKTKTKFVCAECGAESPKWMGKCPNCGTWGSMVEEIDAKASPSARLPSLSAPVLLQDVHMEKMDRYSSGSHEFDRVLGGGIIPGSLFLVGGDPGIGKSTLLLQTVHRIAKEGGKTLYVTGEESPQQVKMRAARLGSFAESLYILAETDLDQIEKHVKHIQPIFLVIDSIQTMFRPALPSAPGSPQQVRECTMQILRFAKEAQIATCIVGHVTKDGTIAGPRLMEHMVDAVLYFEGDRHHRFRILRAVKNRFGSTNEIGVFDMQGGGLEDVASPSEIFLEERTQGAAGSAVVASLEGTRTVLAEIQALVTASAFGQPRRMASGMDYQRVTLLMAVLEKRVGLYLQSQDAYVNVAGGLRIDEPAIDLGICLAITSSFREQPLKPGTVVIGEVGLTGEIRAVTRLEQRIQEVAKLGFTRIIAPNRSVARLTQTTVRDLELIGVDTVADAIRCAIGGS
ncbi:DNA repair protein RadA [Ferroacidibacillus organovorans]|uniref:DNA repair protein RadA n=1 Tax=Ferroacidibacillus organovorans TaxID=1765683 RepID=A0A124IVS1_9BACL|nr:DNA repair protein RadA [Ferroacidibacillus organovorans]KUO95120.1 DNA repair protein RadA [Ferroacidibacillus organovorans]